MTKTDFMKIRVSDDEKESFDLAAKIAGISLSAWVRDRLRRVVRRELQEAGQKVPFLHGIEGDQ
ncbi:MAG: hypothetical protein ABL866_15290 [Devosia sp.]